MIGFNMAAYIWTTQVSFDDIITLKDVRKIATVSTESAVPTTVSKSKHHTSTKSSIQSSKTEAHCHTGT